MEVSVISDNMKMAKKEIEEAEHEQLVALGESDTLSNLVSQFLKSVVTSSGKAKPINECLEMETANKEVLVVNDSLELEGQHNEVLVVNDSVPLGNIPTKSILEDDSLNHNVAARLIADGG